MRALTVKRGHEKMFWRLRIEDVWLCGSLMAGSNKCLIE